MLHRAVPLRISVVDHEGRAVRPPFLRSVRLGTQTIPVSGAEQDGYGVWHLELPHFPGAKVTVVAGQQLEDGYPHVVSRSARMSPSWRDAMSIEIQLPPPPEVRLTDGFGDGEIGLGGGSGGAFSGRTSFEGTARITLTVERFDGTPRSRCAGRGSSRRATPAAPDRQDRCAGPGDLR